MPVYVASKYNACAKSMPSVVSSIYTHCADFLLVILFGVAVFMSLSVLLHFFFFFFLCCIRCE